jgi:hypothetical protein
MALEPKTVTCQCGAEYRIRRPVHYCTACGRAVFYSEGYRRRDRLNNYYVYLAVAVVIGFVVYIFIEMIADPLLKM